VVPDDVARFTTLRSIRRLLVGDESDGNRQDVFLNMFGDALVERIPASIVPIQSLYQPQRLLELSRSGRYRRILVLRSFRSVEMETQKTIMLNLKK